MNHPNIKFTKEDRYQRTAMRPEDHTYLVQAQANSVYETFFSILGDPLTEQKSFEAGLFTVDFVSFFDPEPASPPKVLPRSVRNRLDLTGDVVLATGDFATFNGSLGVA